MRLPNNKFFKDYAVPISATLLLLLIVLLLLLLRYYELLSIRGFAKSNPLITDSESSLVSQDEAAQLNSDDNNQQTVSNQSQTTTTQQTQTTTTTGGTTDNDDGGNTSTPTVPTSGGSSGSGGTSGSGGQTGPFSAIINRLTHYEFPVNTTVCTYNHGFEGEIYINNGPGAVTYQWRRSFPSGFITPVEQFSAPTGFSQRTVNHAWPITQTTTSDYWVELVILSPTPSVKRVNFQHHCP